MSSSCSSWNELNLCLKRVYYVSNKIQLLHCLHIRFSRDFYLHIAVAGFDIPYRINFYSSSGPSLIYTLVLKLPKSLVLLTIDNTVSIICCKTPTINTCLFTAFCMQRKTRGVGGFSNPGPYLYLKIWPHISSSKIRLVSIVNSLINPSRDLSYCWDQLWETLWISISEPNRSLDGITMRKTFARFFRKMLSYARDAL